MKFNREEIIKAKEILEGAKVMILNRSFDDFQSAIITALNTFALIKELAEENEKLKSDLKEAEEEYERVYEQAEADIRGNIADGGTSCHWCIAGHRADAVREMQKRLEELYTDEVITDDMTVAIGVIKQNIKDVAKEILEENK